MEKGKGDKTMKLDQLFAKIKPMQKFFTRLAMSQFEYVTR